MSSAWTVELSASAQKTLRKIDADSSRRITDALVEISTLDDVRGRGKALVGSLKGLWRYRVGDWRLIARIEDKQLVILVIEIGNRRDVYRN